MSNVKYVLATNEPERFAVAEWSADFKKVKPGHRYVLVQAGAGSSLQPGDIGELLAVERVDAEDPDFVEVATGQQIYATRGDVYTAPRRHQPQEYTLIISGDKERIKRALNKLWNDAPAGSAEERELEKITEALDS